MQQQITERATEHIDSHHEQLVRVYSWRQSLDDEN